MGNFDFFSQISGIYASFFAIICLVFSGFMVLKDKRLVYPVICLIVALILDFFATCIAARSSVLFEAGFDIKTHVMFHAYPQSIFLKASVSGGITCFFRLSTPGR